MTTTESPIYIDATMLLRWQHLAPVGIVRLERMLAGQLRLTSGFAAVDYIVWDRGYRPADSHEIVSLDDLLRGTLQDQPEETPAAGLASGVPATPTGGGRAAAVRRTGLRFLGRVPDHLRPFAEQAMWSVATLGVESVRHVKRLRNERRSVSSTPAAKHDGVRHRVDFAPGDDLVALGLGWEYLDHEAMYRLRTEHGVRIHMPAFDLIPVSMPQLNAGQSHLVHRYYAEMAHYADSITSISYATRDALAAFYDNESLPLPHLTVNQLPGLDITAPTNGDRSTRHRFAGDDFVLSVSTIEIRKNHLLLLKIWAECIRESHEMPRLVIVGRLGWDVTELQKWYEHAPELDGVVSLCTDVEDDELIAMYSDTMFTLFPSRVEGWGLPITESLAYGRACVHSTDPAQFEASQGTMPALHPDDFLGWKAEVLRLLDEPAYLAELEQRIVDDYEPRTPGQYCADFEQILIDRRSEGIQS
jgi:glycosyltransferase involved in cell wall biosynthesis